MPMSLLKIDLDKLIQKKIKNTGFIGEGNFSEIL